MSFSKEIVKEIKNLEIDCPDCKYMEDRQYTCTTCWCEGGNGHINVGEWIAQHINDFKIPNNGENI